MLAGNVIHEVYTERRLANAAMQCVLSDCHGCGAYSAAADCKVKYRGAGSMIGVDQSKTFLTMGSFRLQNLKQLPLLD
jgi:hypothetical protein